jgi:hypothetical protein
MSNVLYHRLKFVAQILLPVVGTVYFTLDGIWGLPAAEQVVGMIMAVDAGLGILLHIFTARYPNSANGTVGGDIIVKELDDKKIFSLELNDDPELLETRDEVTFRIKHSS